jgi:hypothetical protein
LNFFILWIKREKLSKFSDPRSILFLPDPWVISYCYLLVCHKRKYVAVKRILIRLPQCRKILCSATYYRVESFVPLWQTYFLVQWTCWMKIFRLQHAESSRKNHRCHSLFSLSVDLALKLSPEKDAKVIVSCLVISQVVKIIRFKF